MHILRQLVFRLRPRQPGSLALDVIEQQVDREVAAVSQAAGEARGIGARCTRMRQRLAAALADERTPGVVDEDEARGLARDLIDTGVKAHLHTKRLEGLVS